MSQTTETSEITSIRSVESNRESTGIALAALLAMLGRGTFAVAQVGTKAAVGASRLAWRGAVKAVTAMSAHANAVQELRPLPGSLRADVMRAGSLDGALRVLARAGTRLANTGTIEPLLDKVETALRLGQGKPARQALSALADEAALQHQHLLADAALVHAEAVVRERGFTTVRIVPERGYLLAERANGEALRVDVVRTRSGGIRCAAEADGFDDDRCITEVDGFYQGMRRHGVITEVIRQVRKPRIPVGRKPARIAQPA